jgi:hypothetical protein
MNFLQKDKMMNGFSFKHTLLDYSIDSLPNDRNNKGDSLQNKYYEII